MPKITIGKDYNYFNRKTISQSSFGEDSDVIFSFAGPCSFSLINEGTGVIEYSFNGNTLHGDLVPGTDSASLIFNDRGYNQIWFRLKSGSSTDVRVEACGGSMFFSGGSGGSSNELNPITPDLIFSSALESSHIVSNSSAKLFSISFRLDATAPTGTYYVQILNASSVPSNGAVTFLCAPIKIQHVQNTDDERVLDFGSFGVSASTGIVVLLSSTEFTKTISGSYLSIIGASKI